MPKVVTKHFKKSKLLESARHGLINYVDIKAKYRHQKKFTCKKTLRPSQDNFLDDGISFDVYLGS